ncbi:MAG: LPS-assembly protein LptD [Deltaproteobacteria bacterium]|nr:LPS-assembly protein LptD [Candidatus Anaeroferrophillus wilburensis]MBN2888664.1 LPS-assembly protein LptD [Deltaproteobacteria bacterium]
MSATGYEEKGRAAHFMLFLFVLVVVMMVLPVDAGAVFDGAPAADTVNIEARHLLYDKVLNRYVAQGEVVVTQESMELKADRVILDNRTREFEAWGNVLMRDRGDYLACRYLKFNLDTKTGVVQQGRVFIKEKNYYITGDRIDKLGPDEYQVEKGILTTCDAAKAAWQIDCDSAHVTKDGYGVVDGAVFKVKEVPVIYLPKGIFPVKTSRQSGLLFPYLGYGQEDGLVTKNAYFWAIDENQDATFFLDTYGHRGAGIGAEYRYVLNERAKGEVRGSYLHDDLAKDKELYPNTEVDRWSFAGRHYQDFANGAMLRAHLNFVSDNAFLDDFPDAFAATFIDALDDVDYQTDNELRSNIFLAKNWSYANLTAEFLYYDSLVKPHNDAVMQLLPQITLTAFEQQLGTSPFYGQLDASYVNFWRETGDRGHRFDLYPRVTLPFHLGPLEVTPGVGVRETAYMTDWENEGSETASRELYEAGVEVKTVLERVYDAQVLGIDRLLHTIEPTVTYWYVSDEDQSDLPRFDALDRLYEQNNITYGLVSRLIGRFPRPSGEGYTYHQYLKAKVSQSYNLINEPNGDQFSSTDDFSNIEAQLEFWSRKYFYGKVEGEFNPYDTWLESFSSLASWHDTRNDRLSLEYRYERDRLEEYTLTGYLPLLMTLDLYGSIRYSLLDNLLWESVYGVNYHPQCWAIDFSVAEEHQPYDLQFRMLLTLNGLGSFGQ